MARAAAALCLLLCGGCAQLVHDTLPLFGAAAGAALGSLGGPATAAAGGAAGAAGGAYAAEALTRSEEVALPKTIQPSAQGGGLEVALEPPGETSMSDTLAWVAVAVFVIAVGGAWWKLYKDSEELDEVWDEHKRLVERVTRLEAK